MIGNVISNPSDQKTGTIGTFAFDAIPFGWLLCDGSAISRTTYKTLFNKIGTAFGAGDGSTTFNLPNFSNKFIEGGTVGSYKNAGLPNITGTFGFCGETSYAQNSGAFAKTDEKSESFTISGTTKRSKWNLNASRSSSIYGNSSTVQPPALCASICIKY